MWDHVTIHWGADSPNLFRRPAVSEYFSERPESTKMAVLVRLNGKMGPKRTDLAVLVRLTAVLRLDGLTPKRYHNDCRCRIIVIFAEKEYDYGTNSDDHPYG